MISNNCVCDIPENLQVDACCVSDTDFTMNICVFLQTDFVCA